MDVQAWPRRFLLPQRLVTLKDEKGQEVVVQVSDQVKRLNEVKVGDTVVVSYTQAVAWQVKPAGKGAPGASVEQSVTKAQPSVQLSGTV